ncbi:MAG: hypothetical protein MUO92_04540 [Dehalococcoidales bacterium]|nr:hypothetical protein [Dehalococcoidales bacterium]
MKRQTLRIIAYCLGVLAWVLVIIGIGFTIIIGIAAATVIARVAFVLGGLVMTAFIAASLLAASRLIYLLIDIEEDLREMVSIVKEKK